MDILKTILEEKEFWLFLSLALFLIIIFKYVFVKIFIFKLKTILAKTENKIDDAIIFAIEKISFYTYLVLSFYISYKILLRDTAIYQYNSIIDSLFLILFSIQLTLILFDFFDKITALKTAEYNVVDTSKTSIANLFRILKTIILFFLIILILSILGVNITPLIAGLGIGGLAFAFAFQNILKDIFSSFAIALDKPYRVGDHIVHNNQHGIIEKIGLKTTRIIGFDGQEIIVPNDNLTSSQIENFGRTQQRRVIFTISVAYNTPTDKLKKITADIEKIISKNEMAEFSRAHLKTLAESSIDFEVVYFVKDRDYLNFLNLNQKIYLELIEHLEKEKIEIPFPSKTVYNK